MNWFKKMIRDFLEIKESDSIILRDVEALNTHAEEVFENKIWYRGNAYELEQIYLQESEVIKGNKHFWSCSSNNIRKIHTGLPAMIVDTLADIVVDNLNCVKVENRQKEWDEIAKENNFKELVKMAVVSTLWGGDGAFKLSYDPSISKNPIIEWFPADRVEYEINRGRITGYIFKTNKKIENEKYKLLEIYTKNSIKYKLINKTGKEEDISKLSNGDIKYHNIVNTTEIIPAIRFLIRKDERFDGRGKSAFSNKKDNFDAFDEIWSQWILSLRRGQLKTYIPENLLPKDPKTGRITRRNDYENDFILLEEDMAENGNNQIKTTQGIIQAENLLATYVTALDQCLTGLISASTLGIDTKKLDNAEAQREKEKTTLYKVNQITDVLKETLKELVNLTLKFKDAINQQSLQDNEIEVVFTSYANPSFEAQVETIGKAKTTGIMSTETQVEQLWGDNKEADWKKDEVKRIKHEQGIIEEMEPAINKENVNLKEEELKKIENEYNKNRK